MADGLTNKMHRTLFDPTKSFLQLSAVRYTIFGIILLSFISGFIISSESELSPRLDYVGFNNAIEIFKVPIGIITLAIPILALLAANHRSEQTREQMRLSNVQNNFSNHFTHIAEFESYCSKHTNNDAVKCIYPRKLYSKVFPLSSDGNYALNRKFIESVNEYAKEFIQESGKLNSKDPNVWKQGLVNIESLVTRICEDFYLEAPHQSSVNTIKYNDSDAYVPTKQGLRGFIDRLKAIFTFLDDVAAFSPGHLPDLDLKLIRNIDLSKIPNNRCQSEKEYIPFSINNVLEKLLENGIEID